MHTAPDQPRLFLRKCICQHDVEPLALGAQVARFVAHSFVSQDFAAELLAAMPPGFVVHDLLACVTQPYMLAKGACSTLTILVLPLCISTCVLFQLILRMKVANCLI